MIRAWLRRLMGDGPRLYRVTAEETLAFLRAIGYRQAARTGRALS